MLLFNGVWPCGSAWRSRLLSQINDRTGFWNQLDLDVFINPVVFLAVSRANVKILQRCA